MFCGHLSDFEDWVRRIDGDVVWDSRLSDGSIG